MPTGITWASCLRLSSCRVDSGTSYQLFMIRRMSYTYCWLRSKERETVVVHWIQAGSLIYASETCLSFSGFVRLSGLILLSSKARLSGPHANLPDVPQNILVVCILTLVMPKVFCVRRVLDRWQQVTDQRLKRISSGCGSPSEWENVCCLRLVEGMFDHY